MPLDNEDQLTLELEALMEEPLFHSFTKNDVNRLSGATKKRRVSDPNPAMRAIHQEIREVLCRLKVDMPHATAGSKGSKVVDHVKRHRGHQYLCCYDLKAAYTHVQPEVMARVLREHGVGEVTIERVLRYCFMPGEGLVTGGLEATRLFNLYANATFDQQLLELFGERGDITYTRYLDDLIISSEAPIGRRFRRSTLQIIRKAGFDIQPSKTQLVDLAAAPTSSVTLNGVGLRVTGELYVPPHYRELLYQLMKQGAAGQADPDFVHGCMSAFYAIKTNRWSMSQSERKVAYMYRHFVHMQRLADPQRAERRRQKQLRYRTRRRQRSGYARRRQKAASALQKRNRRSSPPDIPY